MELPSGSMLNMYLHEDQGFVDRLCQPKTGPVLRSSAAGSSVRTTENDVKRHERAVGKLEKWMHKVTDKALLVEVE
jgi:hypothetical protein